MHEDTFRASDVFLKRSRNSRAVSGSTESSRKATPMRSTTPSNEACDEGEVGPLVIEKKKGNYRKRERERERKERVGGEKKSEKVNDAMRATWPLVGDPGRTGRRRRGKGECQTWGYVHSSPKKACYTTGTPIVLTGQRASFDSFLSFPGSANLWPIPMEIFPCTTSSKRRSSLYRILSDEFEDLLHSFLAIVLFFKDDRLNDWIILIWL